MNFSVSFDESPGFNVEIDEKIVVPKSYNDLTDKPTLNGQTIQGDMEESDPTVPEWAKRPQRPEYSAEDVGAIPSGAALGKSDLEYMWDTTEI